MCVHLAFVFKCYIMNFQFVITFCIGETIEPIKCDMKLCQWKYYYPGYCSTKVHM